MPKSGTYLMAKILEGIGFKDTGWHLDRKRYQDYSKVSLEEGRRNPEGATEHLSFEDMVSKVPEESFALSHLPPDFVLPILKSSQDFKVVFLKRNVLDVFVSFNHWSRTSGRWKPVFELPFRRSEPSELRSFFRAHAQVFERIRAVAGWETETDCFPISFESLTGGLGRDRQLQNVSKLVSWLRDDVEYSATSIIDAALGSDSLTKSDRNRSDRDRYYDQKNLKILEKQGMLELNRVLGYPNPS